MYLDAEISMYQVTKNLFNVEMRVFKEDGSEVRYKRWDRVSWSNGLGLARAAYLSTRASLGAQERHAQDGENSLFQEELPF